MAIPLLVMSGLLHWLVSQSIFLAVVSEYDEIGDLKTSIATVTCGFSPFAVICVMMAGGAIIIFAVVLGMRRFSPKIPVVGSCSMAISAACHRPGWDVDAAIEAVHWGVIPGAVASGGIGHCSFSSGDVYPPTPGHSYAGAPG